jgi:hypothetical protein
MAKKKRAKKRPDPAKFGFDMMQRELGTPSQWRKPEILVDCLLRLAQKEPAELTGQALIDEDFLRSEGVTDFGGYACIPGANPPPLAWPAPHKEPP